MELGGGAFLCLCLSFKRMLPNLLGQSGPPVALFIHLGAHSKNPDTHVFSGPFKLLVIQHNLAFLPQRLHKGIFILTILLGSPSYLGNPTVNTRSGTVVQSCGGEENEGTFK